MPQAVLPVAAEGPQQAPAVLEAPAVQVAEPTAEGVVHTVAVTPRALSEAADLWDSATPIMEVTLLIALAAVTAS